MRRPGADVGGAPPLGPMGRDPHEELRRHVQRFEPVLEISPIAFAITDLDGRVVAWNPAAERLFGYTSEEAMGRSVDDLLAVRPDLQEEAIGYSMTGARGERVQATGRRTRKDGSLVDVSIVTEPVVVNEERIGILVIYHDISAYLRVDPTEVAVATPDTVSRVAELEQELREVRQQYQSLFDNALEGIFRTSADGRWLAANATMARMLGYESAEELMETSHVRDFYADPSDRNGLISRMADDGFVVGYEHHVRRRDGSTMWVLMNAYTVRDENGDPVAFEGMEIDITDRKQSEEHRARLLEKVQQQKRWLESVLKLSPTAIITVDDDMRVTSWNPGAERLFGYTAHEAVGHHLDDLLAKTPELREEAARYSAGGKEVRVITRRTRKDGSLVDVELLVAPVLIGGERVGYSVIYHDIGEIQRAREQAEAATEAKSAFLATMSHEIRTPLNAVIGMTGLLLDTELSPEQRRFAEVIQSSGDALLGVINDILDFSKIEAGRLELEMSPFDLRECVESALDLVAPLATEKGIDLAYELDPDARGVLGDLTRLRQVLLNLLNNSVKFTEQGEVVVTMSSERVPRSGRHRLTFTVRDTGIGIAEDRMHRLFESFSQGDASTTRRYGGTGLGLAISRRLVELMGGSMSAESVVGEGSTFRFSVELDEAEVPSRAFELARAPELDGKGALVVDDNATNRQILARQLATWGMRVRETGSPMQALGWIRDGDLSAVAIVDMQMPEMDGLTLAREVRQVREDLPVVMLTSLGRTPEVPEDAFAGFLTKPVRPSQLFETLMRVFGGPVEEAEPTVPGPEERTAERSPLRILLVEDNTVNQQLAVLLLHKGGYRADVAANGIEALEALERQPYDAVLMDVEMPEMDGLEATRRIRERPPAGRRPWVIAVTANAMQGERERCLQAGMDDYITKPLHFNELTAALGRSTRLPDGAAPAPSVDAEVIRRLAASLGEGGTTSVRELIDTFATHGPEALSSLRRALEQGDADEVRRAAHTLKSNAAMFGASRLTDLSKELEASAKANTLDDGARVVTGIATELERVTHELERLGGELEP